ncbi:MAG: hypothetical protein ACLFMT_03385 [Halobacteriales archaeon]
MDSHEDETVQPTRPPAEAPDEADLPEECRRAIRRIRVHSTKPGRLVFVDSSNSDGWISTDSTVEVHE